MSNKPPIFFVLGAPDHEMKEIERVCVQQGYGFAYATVLGSPVHSYDAYDATGVTQLVPRGSEVVLVECKVRGLRFVDVVDHHQPGDPGYGFEPQNYFEGSSLGQFLRMLGMEPTEEQRIIAAADHCLAAAYQGRCPGVDPEKLKEWREHTRSIARGLSRPELQRQIRLAEEALRKAPVVDLGGHPVAFFDKDLPPEVSEASARLGLAYMYIKRQDDGRIKAGIRSGPPEVIDYWLRNCGLVNTYGDPQRGFAGGYFPSA